VPQSRPLQGQVKNSAGGYSYALDDFGRLERFLVLGTEGGTYYARQHELTTENVDVIRRCLAADGTRTVSTIVEVSERGRAPKNDPAILALAVCASEGDADARARALASLERVCRTGTHLFQFVAFVEDLRGWGRGLRKAVGDWYGRGDLAYQLVKYRQRGGWTHRDVLRLAHPKPKTSAQGSAFAFAVGKPADTDDPELTSITAFQKAQASSSPRETAALVIEYGSALPREALLTDHLKSAEVWAALVAVGMPITATIRNLATMTRVGLLTSQSDATEVVAASILDEDRLRRGRVHPIQVLAALITYQSGHGARGSGEWSPVTKIVDALDAAFYKSFGTFEGSGKRTMLGLDVSGSMGGGLIAGVPGLTPRIGSAAMALVTAATEPSYEVVGFTSKNGYYSGGTAITPLTISPRQRLDDVVKTISDLPFGATDCALPMLYAEELGLAIDTFVIYTDNETWAGDVHPSVALQRYRRSSGIPAKLVVVGMTATGFSIADPNDAGMLDVVGFDTSTPSLIAEFSR
jgi:60 kDa SS-A/Ro ribonucleoprotein